MGVGKVRLVMAELKMQYGRRAETACAARAKISAEVLADVQAKLDEAGRGAFDLHSVVRDAHGEVVAEAYITWHVKSLKG